MHKKEITTEMKKEASAKIADILNQIEKLYDEAAKIGEEFQVGFSYSGPAGYGDGGWYTPKSEYIEDRKEWDDDIDPDWEPSDGEWGWQTSSGSC